MSNTTTEEQLNRITSLPTGEAKPLWVKYYADRWKVDLAELAEAFDRAYQAGWLDGYEEITGEIRKQIQTRGLHSDLL